MKCSRTSIMGVIYNEEPPNQTNRCIFLAAALKEAFLTCHTCGSGRRLSVSETEDDNQACNFDDEAEVVVSVIRSRAMEKLKRKPGFSKDSFSWVYSPATRDLYIQPRTTKEMKDTEDDGKEKGEEEEEGEEEFMSVGSCFSCCSSTLSREAFFSVKSNFSRSSSLNAINSPDYWKHSIFQELCHCQGWPFGLCRKAVLLPPLPKSPSESWMWRKKQQNTV